MIRKRNKLGNKNIIISGEKYDSQAEATRHGQLKILERIGQITELERQKRFELIPAYYEYIETGEYFKRGPNKGKLKTKRILIEHAVDYVADFVYRDKSGSLVVEDVKGYRDASSAPYAKFVIKRKLLLHKYGIKIKEITI